MAAPAPHTSVEKNAAFGHLRAFLASVLLSFAAWLVVNSLFTALSPKMTPVVQAAMFSHRDIGIGFMFFLFIYYPLHIIAAKGFTADSAKAIFAPLAGLIFMSVFYSALVILWEINVYLSILSPTAALIFYELTHGKRGLYKRLFDFLLFLLYALFVLKSTRDGLIRLYVLSLGAYVMFGTFFLALSAFKKNKPDPSGRLLLLSVIFMALFSAMMAGGTNSGTYSPYLPVMDTLHYISSFIFIAMLIFHIRRVAGSYAFARSVKTLVSVPLFAVMLAVFGLWESANVIRYGKFATRIEDTSGAAPARPSPYVKLAGYTLAGRDEWYELPSAGCGTARCHPELSVQHNLSAHGRAFDNDVFKSQLKIFIGEKGRAAADYCITCHAPLAVIKYPGNSPRGREIAIFATKDPAFMLGVGCVVCHRASPDKKTATLGNASLTIMPLWLEKERYLGEDAPEGQKIHNTLIHAANKLHARTYRIPKADRDYVCAACHVVKLPASLSCDGTERKAADQYTSFAESPYAKAGFTCATCHQQSFATYEIQYNTVAHNYLGSGTSLPYRVKDDDRAFRAISLGFLAGLGDITLQTKRRGELPPCIDDIEEYRGRRVILQQRGALNPFKGESGGVKRRDILKTKLSIRARSDDKLEMLVETRNQCSGHTFPSGGGVKAYLEITAYDGSGKIISKYGGLDAAGRPLNTPTTLGGRSADIHGRPIMDRKFWNACEIVYNKRLKPGETVRDAIALTLPPEAAPAAVEAVWYYLRPEYFRRLEGAVTSPVAPVEIGKAKIQI